MFKKIFDLFKTVKPTPKPNKGKLCECYGDIHTKNNRECEYFPLQGGYHTAFLVGECNKCGGLSGFPHFNLKLAIKDGTEDGKKALAAIGYKF